VTPNISSPLQACIFCYIQGTVYCTLVWLVCSIKIEVTSFCAYHQTSHHQPMFLNMGSIWKGNSGQLRHRRNVTELSEVHGPVPHFHILLISYMLVCGYGIVYRIFNKIRTRVLSKTFLLAFTGCSSRLFAESPWCGEFCSKCRRVSTIL
jgi:hypothetical protein